MMLRHETPPDALALACLPVMMYCVCLWGDNLLLSVSNLRGELLVTSVCPRVLSQKPLTGLCHELKCADGIDNDHNGQTDCDDRACARSPKCSCATANNGVCDEPCTCCPGTGPGWNACSV